MVSRKVVVEFRSGRNEHENTIDKNARAVHAHFCPFADRLYRSALIVTGNPGSAEQFQQSASQKYVAIPN